MKKIDVSNLKNFSRKGRDRVRNTAIAAGTIGTLYGAKQWKDFVDTHRFDKNIMATNPADGLKLEPEESAVENNEIDNGVISMDNFSDKKNSIAKKIVKGLGVAAGTTAGVGVAGLGAVTGWAYLDQADVRTLQKEYKESLDAVDGNKKLEDVMLSLSPTSLKAKYGIRDLPIFKKIYDDAVNIANDNSYTDEQKEELLLQLPREVNNQAHLAGDPNYLWLMNNFTDKKSLAKKVAAGLGAGASLAAGAGSVALASKLNNDYKDQLAQNLNQQTSNFKTGMEVIALNSVMRSPKLYDMYKDRLLEAGDDPVKTKEIIDEINNMPVDDREMLLQNDISNYTYNFSKKSSNNKEKALATAGLLTTAGGLTGAYISGKKGLEADAHYQKLLSNAEKLNLKKEDYEDYLKNPEKYVNSFKKAYGTENKDTVLGRDYYKETHKDHKYGEDDKLTYGENDKEQYLKDVKTDATLRKIYNPNLESDSKDAEKAVDENDAFLSQDEKMDKFFYNVVKNPDSFKKGWDKFDTIKEPEAVKLPKIGSPVRGEPSVLDKAARSVFEGEKNHSRFNDHVNEKYTDHMKKDWLNSDSVKGLGVRNKNPEYEVSSEEIKNATTPKVEPFDITKLGSPVLKPSNIGINPISSSNINDPLGSIPKSDIKHNIDLNKVMEENENTGLDPVVEYFYSDLKSLIDLPNSKSSDAYDFSDRYDKKRKAIVGTVAGLGAAGGLGVGAKWLYDNQYKPLPQVSPDHNGLNPDDGSTKGQKIKFQKVKFQKTKDPDERYEKTKGGEIRGEKLREERLEEEKLREEVLKDNIIKEEVLTPEQINEEALMEEVIHNFSRKFARRFGR